MPSDSEAMRNEMNAEMKGVLGSGYVPDLYDQMADGFVMIAEFYIDRAVAKAKRDCRTRPRYKFMGRVGNIYVWQGPRVDSRVEEITCNVDAFWNPHKGGPKR